MNKERHDTYITILVFSYGVSLLAVLYLFFLRDDLVSRITSLESDGLLTLLFKPALFVITYELIAKLIMIITVLTLFKKIPKKEPLFEKSESESTRIGERDHDHDDEH